LTINNSVGGCPVPTRSVFTTADCNTNANLYATVGLWLVPHHWAYFNSIQTIKPQAFRDRGPVKDTD